MLRGSNPFFDIRQKSLVLICLSGGNHDSSMA